jgi:hypothetical protein
MEWPVWHQRAVWAGGFASQGAPWLGHTEEVRFDFVPRKYTITVIGSLKQQSKLT